MLSALLFMFCCSAIAFAYSFQPMNEQKIKENNLKELERIKNKLS